MMLQPVAPAIPAEVHQLKADLSGLCNNVNQIARAVNAKAREPTKAMEEAALCVRRIYELVNEVREMIAHGV